MLQIKLKIKKSKNLKILENRKIKIDIPDKINSNDVTDKLQNLLKENNNENPNSVDDKSNLSPSQNKLSPTLRKQIQSNKNIKDKTKSKYNKGKDNDEDENNKTLENLIFVENSILNGIDENILETLNNLGINFNNPEEIEKIRDKLSSIFANDKSEIMSGKWTPQEKRDFSNFILNLIKLEYKGYDYKIVPERDYFNRGGKLIETILNNEDAAIKRCEQLFDEMEINGEFIDKDFGPQINDNGVGNKFSLYLNGNALKGHMDPTMIEWYRMTQISSEPHFIDDGAEANDVMQGALGDCWFISALSVLATKDHLLRGEFNSLILNDGDIDQQENVMLSSGIYPPIFHKFRKKNIFCFRFYKDFEFRYVIIDDQLPCRKVYQQGQVPKLLYGKCRNDKEFWVPLIEKAYAKLHGCYEALISGFIDDGLVDLTGFASKKVFINPVDFKTKEDTDKLWEMLKYFTKKNFNEEELGKKKSSLKAKYYLKNNSMVGCSVDSKVVESEVIYHNHKAGILAGHAYALLDAFTIKKEGKEKESRLLRIRNPWGFKEWNGKWSDESEEIDKNREKLQQILDERYKGTSEKVVLDAEDGTFIMCFSDFRYF